MGSEETHIEGLYNALGVCKLLAVIQSQREEREVQRFEQTNDRLSRSVVICAPSKETRAR